MYAEVLNFRVCYINFLFPDNKSNRFHNFQQYDICFLFFLGIPQICILWNKNPTNEINQPLLNS